VVTTNNSSLSVYEFDRMLTDLLLARGAGVARDDLDAWITDRRQRHDRMVPPSGVADRSIRRAARAGSPLGRTDRSPRRRGTGRTRPLLPRRAVDAVYDSPHTRTLDVLGLDYYDPEVSRQLRLPGQRTVGGGAPGSRQRGDRVPEPLGLARWLATQHELAPDLPLWVVENGLGQRTGNDHPGLRPDGWDRRRYLREHLGAVVAAVDAGIPVAGYWHRSLMDGYEWGSYEPRFGLYGVERNRGRSGWRWMETDAAGDDSAGTYRLLIAGLRSGDRSVLGPG
jgi:hypothetical protein